jgi:hypothetical protein
MLRGYVVHYRVRRLVILLCKPQFDQLDLGVDHNP